MNLNATLLGQSITFAVFVWFCMKYIWPILREAMHERQQAIAAGLASAEAAEKQLAEASSGAADELAKAKDDAAQLIEQARQRANQMVEDAKTEAREEGERIVEAARAEVEQEMNRAKETLRTQVAALAISGAERVLESDIDAGKHSQMLERLAQEL